MALERFPVDHSIDNRTRSDLCVLEKVSGVKEIPCSVVVNENMCVDCKFLLSQAHARIREGPFGTVGDSNAYLHQDLVARTVIKIEFAVVVNDLRRPIKRRSRIEGEHRAAHFAPTDKIVGPKNKKDVAIRRFACAVCEISTAKLQNERVRKRMRVDRVFKCSRPTLL